MDARTLTALEGSIAKWRSIVDGNGFDEGSGNCPLCAEFVNVDPPDAEDEDGCYGCPVSDKAGTAGCCGTPYEKWSDYMADKKLFVGNPYRKVFDDRSKALAQAEMDYLKSLLPSQSAALGEGEKHG